MVPSPLWGTFTGHCEGEWLGQYAAYTPWGGDPEPVWADESGAYLLNAYSRASEQRQQVPADADADTNEDADMLVRTTLRSASVSSLIGGTSASRAAARAAAERAAARAAEAAAGGSAAAAAAAVGGADAAAAEEAAAADDDAEGFAYNSGGSVVFNGGSYSIGPEQLEGPELEIDLQELAAEDPDALANLPHSTAVFEAALVAGGDVRLRMVATLKLRQLPGEAELDVEVARLLLYKEYWYGTAESTAGLTRKSKQLAAAAAAAAADADTPSSSSSSESPSGHVLQLLPSHKFDVPVVNLPRPQPQQLAGCWNVFLVAANPVVEENPDTLQEEEVLVRSGNSTKLEATHC
ncbi:hypothetical protein OEZ85_007868 [Tetradesmus obliquus]|uniref:Uncharacterized protein n=1 Tax=Tetradesmus obliquus TaxID=3088 RepID=A0ABY8TKV2_TETOB|nr:hypothetical protein OEZ85_007868 [Tetradesmus obliquus]